MKALNESLCIQEYVLVATLPLFHPCGFALLTQASMFIITEAAGSTLIFQESMTKTFTAVL